MINTFQHTLFFLKTRKKISDFWEGFLRFFAQEVNIKFIWCFIYGGIARSPILFMVVCTLDWEFNYKIKRRKHIGVNKQGIEVEAL